MLDNIAIEEIPEKDNSVTVKQSNFNELIILLPLADFTIKVATPLFNIEGISPAEITLTGLTINEFLLQINTEEFSLSTIVPSLVLEVFNPDGVRIIRIVAPPE